MLWFMLCNQTEMFIGKLNLLISVLVRISNCKSTKQFSIIIKTFHKKSCFKRMKQL